MACVIRAPAGSGALARVTVFLCIVAACSACATRSAGIDQRMILPEGTARYSMAANQAFVYPLAKANPPPAFPAGYELGDLPPTTLCASFVVDASGGVRNAALLENEPGCGEAAAQPVLGRAVLAAVSAWRFEPAMFCIYPDEATRNRDWNGSGCAGAVAEAKVVPVSLAYAFTFEVRGGRRQVGAARVAGR